MCCLFLYTHCYHKQAFSVPPSDQSFSPWELAEIPALNGVNNATNEKITISQPSKIMKNTARITPYSVTDNPCIGCRRKIEPILEDELFNLEFQFKFVIELGIPI